jgi:hypothetical protein
MQRENRKLTIELVCLTALALFIGAQIGYTLWKVAPEMPRGTRLEATADGWHLSATDPPTFGVSLVGLWERPGQPGRYDVFCFVRIGPEFIDDSVDATVARAVARRMPTAWIELP